MIIRAFTILSMTLLALGFMGANYIGVDQPHGTVSPPAMHAGAIDIG
jgi:hypothetical protein